VTVGAPGKLALVSAVIIAAVAVFVDLRAAAVALVMAATIVGLASYYIGRNLETIAAETKAIAGKRRFPDSGDHVGDIRSALDRIAIDIQGSVAALAHERAMFGAVLEGMSQGVVALDGEQRILVMNRAAQSMFGLDKAPLRAALIDYVRVPALHELIAHPVAGRSDEFELPGGPRLLLRVTPLPSGDGCVLVLEDVSEIRRLETVRRDFVYNASHELRTPVSVIRANAETLIAGAKEDPLHRDRLLDGLHRNAERLSSIITDLLDLSRIEAGKTAFARESVELATTVASAAETVEAAARTKQVKVAIELEPGLRAAADGRALEQVLINLIDNAVKYTPFAGRVWVTGRTDGKRVRLEVTDDGPGIATPHRERVFERFYRVDAGRSREVGGTGLGLSIVKHLVEAMDGSVGVSPRQPHGSIFWVDLPRAAPSN
jgi:two-component system phosphate regulon sensor histidine kinase PhoR